MRTRLWKIFPALLVLLITCHGCRGSGASHEPIHLHVVCPAGAGGRAVACEESERLSAFDAWVGQAALSRPGSTLTIWAVGPDRQHHDPYFAACVPPSWGAGAREAKTFFLRKAREGVRAGGPAFPRGCAPPGPEAPGIHRLQVSATISPADSRVWQAVAPGPAAGGPLHMAIVCDRSDSTLGLACDASGLLGAFDLWVADGRAATGASLAVYRVGSSRDTTRLAYILSVPEQSVGEKAAFLLGARRELTRLLADTAEKNASALAEAAHVAVGEMRERRGRHRLVILSDLRQFTPGIWNFERSVPDAQGFIAWLQDEKLFADLKGVPVIACGSHNRRGPGARPYDARLMTQIRETWDSAFRAMGATEVGMFTTCEAAFAPR